MGGRAEWTVRRAGPADAAALALVGAATFLESYAALLPGADIVAHCARTQNEAAYRGWLADPRSALWLVEAAGGAPLGFCLAATPDLPLVDVAASDVEIRRIYALGMVQGQGAGRTMIDAAAGWARVQGAERLLLGVYKRNLSALGFYARMGFVTVGERAFTVGANRYDDWVLAKAL